MVGVEVCLFHVLRFCTWWMLINVDDEGGEAVLMMVNGAEMPNEMGAYYTSTPTRA